ncbi:MAG: STT3 domain-containing protein [Nanoarchaeota archaeon]
MSEDSISFKFKENWQGSKRWFYIALGLLLVILILGTYIRTTNIPQLKDVTTGGYTLGPDLDPFLYLRTAYEIIDYGKILNPDYMRYHGAKPYYNFLPYGIAYLYKLLNLFQKDVSLEYAAIIFPVIFFGLSIIVFFFFVRELFPKKEEFQKSAIAVIATAIYSVLPLMQHRTTAGIPELESAGLFFFWLSFFFFLKAWHDDKKILNVHRGYLLALASGISTALMTFTWGGFRFIFYALPLAVMIAFLLGKVNKKETIIYSLWFVPSFLFLGMKVGFKVAALDVTHATIALFVFLVLIVNILINEGILNRVKRTFKKDWINKEIISLVLVILGGFIVLVFLKPSLLIGILVDLKEHLLYPFGRSRVGLTVAENKPLYVVDIFSSFGVSFFWMFFFGLIFLFCEAVKSLEKRDKIVLITSFIAFVIGLIFSRYSPESNLFNGVHPVSQIVYFSAMIVFSASIIYVYVKNLKSEGKLERFKEIEFSYIFVLLLTVLMIVASRGAIRLLVISSPVFIIPMAFLPLALMSYRIKSKDDLLKLFLLILLLVSLFYTGLIFKNYEAATSGAVKYTIPGSDTVQWQMAMAWVRENTAEQSMFVHWWDYGYWVQTIGKRPTVTDGGHEVTYWDHLIGRYLLTTPNPDAALSFMKTHNVSYLLIDPSDLGKYPAYSSIGGDGAGGDRFAQIPIMLFNPSQIRETSTGEMRIYQGGAPVDQDIVYNTGDGEVFLPSDRAVVIGTVIEVVRSNNSNSFKQPQAVFVYNQKQTNIPIRYLYYENKFSDFGSGLDAVIKIIPSVSQDGQGVQIDGAGAIIYLSPRVSKGLFAQLYLLNDPLKEYGTVSVAHSQPDLTLDSLNKQGANLGNMAYINGFRGPIQIWKVDYPNNILVRDEFLRRSGEYAEFDTLQFIA